MNDFTEEQVWALLGVARKETLERCLERVYQHGHRWGMNPEQVELAAEALKEIVIGRELPRMPPGFYDRQEEG